MLLPTLSPSLKDTRHFPFSSFFSILLSFLELGHGWEGHGEGRLALAFPCLTGFAHFPSIAVLSTFDASSTVFL
ncbi:uncharacterized protein BKA78DRAFT_312099 [Phyllosticta capitalensis]|uniref:uncharacterized protein n=1 Tax=Phyllosticta capitalensis TaxID=121624 RepID=UPI00313270DE